MPESDRAIRDTFKGDDAQTGLRAAPPDLAIFPASEGDLKLHAPMCARAHVLRAEGTLSGLARRDVDSDSIASRNLK